MRTGISALAILLGLAGSASATVIYLPVTYVSSTSPRFYYGGSDPATIARADRAASAANATNQTDVPQPIRVYSDALPFVPDAGIYGFTAGDARNAAYLAVPRYFRMADLLLNSRVDRDGTVWVPATTPGTIEITPFVRQGLARPMPAPPTTRPVLLETRQMAVAR